MKGELEAKNLRMQEYLNQVRHLQSRFESFTLLQIPKSRNRHSDSLTTFTTSLAQILPRVILTEDLCKPTRKNRENVQIHQIRVGPSWMDSIMLFLKDVILPEKKEEADRVQRKAPCFWFSEDQKLYKCSFSGPYFICIHLEAVESLLEELHEGIYRSHTRGRSLSHRTFI